MKLGIYKCHPEATLPFYATDQAACFDLTLNFAGGKVYSKNFIKANEFIGDSITIPAGGRAILGTGLKLDIPEGYQLKLHVRSSTGIKKDLHLANITGIIDSDYVDELMIALKNPSKFDYLLRSGKEVLVQGELQKVIQCGFEELKEAPKTKGNRVGGLGSTGE
tara:strand:- start:5285 stop:5776 length:492 start_codon:yes stop_codon:yes gene_type:complete